MTEKPGYININDYSYVLPDERIAKYPLGSRDSSKLLYYNLGLKSTKIFRELSDLLSENHHLIFNDTKVIHARLIFNKKTGSTIEIFLLEPFIPSEYTQSFSTKEECTWKCLVGNAKKWKDESLQKELNLNQSKFSLYANKEGQEGNYFIIRFRWDNSDYTFSNIIESAGNTPIPPYLNRLADIGDSIRYQTVYSKHEGSVAAPTAGLHFTDDLLNILEKKGISQTRVTLHVGAGTFVPVKVENAVDHIMHTEHIYLNRKCIESLYRSDKLNVAVGTTSVRTIESLYHIAVKISKGSDFKDALFLDQWEAYQHSTFLTRREAMEIILGYMDKKNTDMMNVSTRIMISPGYKFRMTDAIITNFHQPASTLLLLISAFVGDDWKEIYNYALQNDFRFLSYGDSSLLFRNEQKIHFCK